MIEVSRATDRDFSARSGGADTPEKPAEVIVDGDQVHLVRRRETPEELFALESLIR